ncbi:MAG: hypothetical protein JRN35_10920 [Nitrososphaerota archaeon]|nr:hypothetical protein [Nitrososphaerota archaeon]
MTPPSTSWQALQFAWKHLILFLLIGAGFFVLAWTLNVSLLPSLFGTLLAAKIGFVSLLAAALTFLYHTFWDETNQAGEPENPEKDDYILATVKQYKGLFLLLLGAILATVTAITADLVTAIGNPSRIWVTLSLASFLTAMVLLVAFLLSLVGRTIANMQTLSETFSSISSKRTPPQAKAEDTTNPLIK